MIMEKVQIFIPCFVDQLFPQTAINMLRFLRSAGYEVEYNTNQTCCGQPAYNAGHWKEATEISRKCFDDLSLLEHPVIIPSASCTGFLKNYSLSLFNSKEDKVAILDRTYEFSDFVNRNLDKFEIKSKLYAKAVILDSCASTRECKVNEGLRKILRRIEGLEIIDIDDADQCCGFGGTFSVKFEPISVAMAEKKIHSITKTDAEYIISVDLSCLMQLDAYIKNKNLDLKVIHLADVLAMC
jgi:L-lactate dehydrogenase complex protein LldE